MDYATKAIAHPGLDPLDALIANEDKAQQVECKIIGTYFDSLDGNIHIEVEQTKKRCYNNKTFYVTRKLTEFSWLMLMTADIMGKECLLDKVGPDAKIIEIY